MPGYAQLEGILGNGPLNDLFTPDTTQRFAIGTLIGAVDPYFGYGEFVYGKSAAAAGVGRVVYQSDQTYVMTDHPNTANTGRCVLVARSNFSAANQFGWFQRAGTAPWSATASVAAGVAFGITGAGQVGANTAGKQILNATVLQAGTFTLTKSAQTSNGSAVVQVANVDGLFIGLTVSGTGIPGATTISSIDASGNSIVMSANATATGLITMTGTYTNFLLVAFQNAFVQGAIT